MGYAIVCTISAIDGTRHRNSRNDEFRKVLYRFDAASAAYGLVSAIVIARAERGDSFRARKLPSTSTRFGRSPPGGVTQ
jgi:hypothetical protein